MILSALDNMKIPYIIIRYTVFSPVIEDRATYRYQIFTHNDPRLKRLGFRSEHEIWKYQKGYMFRNMNKREVKVFRAMRVTPDHITPDGVIWEFNGRIRRRTHPLSKKIGFTELHDDK